jgi:hypothetical protein
MTPLRKHWLRVEVGICFLPLAMQLVLGLIIAPLQLHFLVAAEDNARLGALLFFMLIAVAICGFVALHSVMTWLLHGRRTGLKPKTVAILAGIGLLPLLAMVPAVTNAVAALVVIPPLLCSIHLIWLARDYFLTPAAPISESAK